MNYLPNLPTTQDRILVVDDSPENLFLIESILQDEGAEILLAQDGFTALDIVSETSPHLILLDVMMPKIDGFEVTRRIRSNPTLPFIPILLITAYDHPSAVKGLDLGADDFLRKPVDVDELLARVRSLLRLKHSVDQTEQISKLREDFVSRLTHDLRTPLVAADRMLLLLQQGAFGELSSEMDEAIQTMTRSNRHLLEMVNTLLEVYRYEADRKTLNFSLVDLKGLAQEVINALLTLATEKGLSLTLEIPESEQNETFHLQGDRLELNRLLTNLIGNAIKFTDHGAIVVRFFHKADQIVLEVEDTGPGIPSEEQAGLFERFRTGSHRRSGSGLGLHLSRQIVESHQGTIEVESELDKGSLFRISLPHFIS